MRQLENQAAAEPAADASQYSVIFQGAEAEIRSNGSNIIKTRISKQFKHRFLDVRHRRQRTKSEANLLRKASDRGVRVPAVLECDDYSIKMSLLPGKQLTELLRGNEASPEALCSTGEQIWKLHSADIVHGDLTPSNIIIYQNTASLLDFGLGTSGKARPEEKAVDLYVLQRALSCMGKDAAFAEIIEAYGRNEALAHSTQPAEKEGVTKESVLSRLESVQMRGRKREREDGGASSDAGSE